MGVQPVHDPDGAHEQTTDNGSMDNDQRVHDPDSAYELTTDNVKKILAIHMRFRYALVIIKPSDGLLTVE